MRRAICILLSVFGSMLVIEAADLPEHWRSWRYSRTILQNSPSATASENVAELPLPWDLFAHCNPALSDLRIVDDQGQEVAYDLKSDRGSNQAESHEARIVENSFVAGKYTQVVGELGHDAPFYDRVRVETALSDFIVWTEVALSDDAKTWRIVEPRAPIARFRKRSVDGTQTIPFQGLNSRFIRVRIFETERPFAVGGLTVLRSESHRATLVEVPSTFSPANSDDTAETAWTTYLATSRVPVSRLTFATDTPEFYRAVRISGSDDGKVWNYRGSGVIFRYKQRGKTRESLSVDFPEWPENRLLRVDVINGNDQPLRGAQLTLSAIPRVLVFKASPNAAYRIIYGNERAAAPQYDLSHYLEVGAAGSARAAVSLATEEATANYRDPRPFSERHPEVLWISLGIAILLIGVTAVKTLRAPNPRSPGDPA